MTLHLLDLSEKVLTELSSKVSQGIRLENRTYEEIQDMKPVVFNEFPFSLN